MPRTRMAQARDLLRVENARLRQALTTIADDCYRLSSDAPEKGERRAWKAIEVIARAALKPPSP